MEDFETNCCSPQLPSSQPPSDSYLHTFAPFNIIQYDAMKLNSWQCNKKRFFLILSKILTPAPPPQANTIDNNDHEGGWRQASLAECRGHKARIKSQQISLLTSSKWFTKCRKVVLNHTDQFRVQTSTTAIEIYFARPRDVGSLRHVLMHLWLVIPKYCSELSAVQLSQYTFCNVIFALHVFQSNGCSVIFALRLLQWNCCSAIVALQLLQYIWFCKNLPIFCLKLLDFKKG